MGYCQFSEMPSHEFCVLSQMDSATERGLKSTRAEVAAGDDSRDAEGEGAGVI